MKKIILLAAVLTLVLSGVAFAAIATSPHDLSTGTYGASTDTSQICVFCHHPHRGTQGTLTNALIWNLNDWTGSPYSVYTSATMDASATGSAVNDAAPQSYLCMACHDGTISAGALVQKAGDSTGNTIDTTITITGAAAIDDANDLLNDHPVNFTYATAVSGDADIIDGSVPGENAGTADYPLYSGKMQCATCHDVHAGGADSSDASINFMRGNTAGSAICLACHSK